MKHQACFKGRMNKSTLKYNAQPLGMTSQNLLLDIKRIVKSPKLKIKLA